MRWDYLLAQDDNLLRFLSELLPQPLDLIFHIHHLAWSVKHRDSPGFLHLFPQLHQLLQTNDGLVYKQMHCIKTQCQRPYLPGIKIEILIRYWYLVDITRLENVVYTSSYCGHYNPDTILMLPFFDGIETWMVSKPKLSKTSIEEPTCLLSSNDLCLQGFYSLVIPTKYQYLT